MSRRISKETIDAVTNAADIVSLIKEYTDLEQRGNDWWGCCPFHNEKTPSFSVSAEKKIYYCFGCHAGGNVIKFIMEQEKLSYTDAVSMLASRSGITLTFSGSDDDLKYNDNYKLIEEYTELYSRTASMFHYLLTESEKGKSALEYITKRGITIETIKKFQLGFAPANRRWLKKFLLGKNFSIDFLNSSGLFSKKYPDISFFSNRLMFPIFNKNGKTVAFGGRKLDENTESPKYLNTGDLLQYKKGETLYAFNFAKKMIREKRKVIFCEGYIDCIAYHQCGIENAVAPLGTALTEEQIKIIHPFADEVLLSFDSDAAGENATMRAVFMLRKAGFSVKIIQFSGGKDPAEIMIKFGNKVLINQISAAIIDSDFFLSKLKKEYPIDTPDGKTKASLAFFSYIDSLSSDIQKESCLEKLCQEFNLKPEAVNKDFKNRQQARERLNARRPVANMQKGNIKLTAELRSVLAVTAHLEKYEMIRTEVSADDFEDPVAKQLYIILEECFKKDTLSLNSVLNHCSNTTLSGLITTVISLGEFELNTDNTINDSIRLIRKKSIERKRTEIIKQIKVLTAASDDKGQLERLLAEKMELDRKLIH